MRPRPRRWEQRTLIETIDLTKRYGDLYAIRSIDLKLEKGDLFGFIGPNGAGKTTTMRIIATLLNPTWGEAYVGGYSIYKKPREIRRLVGYMPDFFGVYDDMKVIEYLEFFAAAYRIRGPKRRQVCDRMLQVVDLDFKRDAFANTLSRGQTQRLGLARVLLHDPEVLLLDEPLSGLDPRARIEMRNLLKSLRGMGKTIIVSSHILPELADICNKIGIIDRGVMNVSADVAEVMKRVRQYVVLEVQVVIEQESAAELLREDPAVRDVQISEDRLVVTLREGVDTYDHLATQLVNEGFGIRTFREEELSLEAAFMALTKGMGAGADGAVAEGAGANGATEP
jgi:ABC-2 type transport system ATP-binding protein